MKNLLTLFTMLLLCIASTWAEDYSQGYYTMSPGAGASYFGFYSSDNESSATASVYGGSTAPKNAVIFTFEKTDQSDVYYWYDCNNRKYVYANSAGYLKTSDTKVTDDDNYKWYIKDDGNGNLTITDMTGYNSGNPTKGLVQLSSVGGWWASKCTLSSNTGRNTWKLNLLFKKDTPYYIGLQRSSDRYLQYGSGNMQQASVSEKTNSNIFYFTDAGDGAINIYSLKDNTPRGYALDAVSGAGKIATANAVKNFYVRRTNNDSYPFAFLTEAGSNALYLSNHGGTAQSNMGLYSSIDDSGTRLKAEEVPLETLFADLLTTARQLVAPGRSHAGHPGFPALDIFDALQDAITVAEAVDTPTGSDVLALNSKINQFTSSTILLTLNKLYRFETACTSKPGYVISANASNGLIWGALDVTDGKQIWRTTWLSNGTFGTIKNVGTGLYPQGKAHNTGQLQLAGDATNTQIVALGTNTGQFNIKPNNQGAMHMKGWNWGTSTVTEEIIAWNSTDAGSASAWYIYEVEQYTVSITGDDGTGRIIVNGTEYADGQSFYNTKGSELTAVAKNIANHTTGDVVVDGNTISVTYTEATTVDLSVVYRYTDDNGDWVELKSGTESVAAGATAQVPVTLTADETLRFTGGTYQIGDGETTAFTMGSFAEAYTGNISFTAPDAGATLYVNLQVRPLPTTGKLYRFYNVSNSIHWMYNTGTRLAVTSARKSDRSDMFYLVEAGTGVYKFVSALNGNGYNQVTWQNQTNPVRYERTGRLTIARESSDLSVLIGQSGKTGTLQYLHANGDDDGHQVVVWSNSGGNSRWYVEEVPASEIADPALEIAKVEATRVLNKRGVGYPTASSAAYAALRTAVNAADATAETINAAVTAYSATTAEIQMPEDGKTYTVTSVSKDDTKRYYMNYAEAGYTLVATTGLKDGSYPTTAYLTCKVVGDKYAFVNEDGKYFIFKGGSSSGADNSNKGYVDTYNPLHDFTVSRMTKGGNCTSENDAYLGYVSMMGYRPTIAQGTNDVYFVIGSANGTYDHAASPYFNDSYSSALALDEVSGHTPSTAASEAIEKIDVAIGKAEALALISPYTDKIAPGTGNYTVTLGEDDYTDASSVEAAIESWASLSDCVTPVITINQPTSGYYRILNKGTQRYVNCTKVDNAATHTSAGITGDDEAMTIFYIDEDKNIQAYDNGAYWKGVYRMGRGTFVDATYGELTYKHPWQFIEGNTLGTYKLIYGNDTEGKYHATGSGEATGYAGVGSAAADADAATWTLVAVTELPDRTEAGSTERSNEITYAPAGTIVPATVPNVLVTTAENTYQCNNLQLTDDLISEFGSGTRTSFVGTNVTYNRATSANQWGTICLPYAVSTDGDVAYYRLVAPVGDQTLRFERVTDATTTAYEPYLIKKAADAGLAIGASGAEFELGNPAPQDLGAHNGFVLKGIMVNTSVIDGTDYLVAKNEDYVAVTDPDAYYFEASSNTFRALNGRFNLKAFRAYLSTTDGTASARSILGIDISEDGQATGISIVESEDGKTVDIVYDLNGRRLQEARKGINIINGKKVIK